VHDANETKNVAAIPGNAGIVAELSKFLPPPITAEPKGAPAESKKENKKGKKGGKFELELKRSDKPQN
jgi:hypothetical protein